MLYKLPRTLLSQRSKIFETLFSLPQGESTTTEGKTDDDPIRLPIDSEDFDRLVAFLFEGQASCRLCSHHSNSSCRYCPAHINIPFLSSLLKLSVFLEIQDGEAWAVEWLPKLPDFTPAYQLFLARMHRIDHWVEPTFRQLMTIPVTELSIRDVDWIGLQYYHILIKTKAKIDQHRRYMAFSAPDVVNDPFCIHADACNQAWIAEWWRGVAPQLLHPDEIIPERQILGAFDTVMIPGVCDGCQGLSIEWVRAKDVFGREEAIVDDAVKEVMAIQTDEAIRTSLRNVIIPN